MKTKELTLIGILIIAIVAMVAPVMAAPSDTGTATVTGDVTRTITLTVHGDTIQLDLIAGADAKDDTTATLDVSSNTPGWTVSVKDALDKDQGGSGASKTSAGYMVDYLTTGGGTWGSLHLASPLNVGSASKTGFTGASVDLSGADQAIETGASDSTAANDFTGTQLTFTQPVVITDSVLPTDHTYRVIVTFTGSTL